MSSESQLTLGEVVALQRGTTYKSSLLDQPGPVLLGLASIQRDGGFRTDSLRTYGGESPAKLILKPGDLYVSLKDVTQSGDLLGAASRVPSTVVEGRLTQDTVKLTLTNVSIPRDYVYWLLRTPRYREYCRAHAIGTTNLSISREDFLAFPIPKPSTEQLELVKILDQIETKIDLNRRMNETLESMAWAIFKSWFVDFDPVRTKAEGREPAGIAPETAALFPDAMSTVVPALPIGWPMGRLSDVTDKIGSGATPRGGAAVYVVDGCSLIRSQNVHDSNFVWKGLVRLSMASADELRNVEVRPEDVLINITGDSILRTCVVDEDALPARVNQHVSIVRPKAGIPSRFIHCHLLNPDTKAYLLGLDAGGTRKAITKGHLEALPTLLPPRAVLHCFESIVKPMDDLRCRNIRELRTLIAIRDTLLPKLVSGEIRIPEAEKLVEANV